MKKLIMMLLAFLLFISLMPVTAQDDDLIFIDSDDEEFFFFDDFDEEIVIDDAAAETAASGEEKEVKEKEPVYDEADLAFLEASHLTIGNATPMRGDFFTDMWGNATSDIDIRYLMHAYGLIRWDALQGQFYQDDSVVSGMAVADNELGDRSFYIIIYDDLYYSDGTRITAKDYAFSILLTIAPEIEELGGKPDVKEYILGYQDYIDGTADTLAGVRILGDDSFVITLDHEYLPFFYELGLLSCVPYPIHVIAPGVEVRDDGKGVYLANIDDSITEPIFTADLLRKTIMDPETGYRTHPSVVSGPYILTAWNPPTAEFEVNPQYKGNYNGNKPSIKTLTVTLSENDSMVEKLKNGEFDLLNKVTRSDTIMNGMSLIEHGYQMGNYPRYGLSYIGFACENPTVYTQEVRQALAYCLDRDALTYEYAGNFGLRVDSWYGIAFWVYSVINGTLEPPIDPPEDENDTKAAKEYEQELEEWGELTLDGLTLYSLDLDKARALLDKDGWELNPDGLREKVIDGHAVVLDLKLVYPVGNNINEALEKLWIPNLEEVGIRLTLEPMEMVDLLSRFYRHEERDMDMFYLALNFDPFFDPSSQFDEDIFGGHTWFNTEHVNDDLYEAAVDMRRTEPGDYLEYAKKWVKFEEMFSEDIPMLPVYSNIYFDFFTKYLRDYSISHNDTWSQAIIDAYLGADPIEVEEDEIQPGTGESEIIVDEFGDEDEFLEFDDDEFFYFDD